MSRHEVVTVDATDHHTVSVDSGEALENVVYDITADGASLTISAHGTGWALRHLAIVGHNDADAETPVFDVSDRGNGQSVIENVSLADGGTGPGLSVDRRHNGALTVVRSRISNFAEGGAVSHTPRLRGGGEVLYDRCYVAGCYEANYHTGDDTLLYSVADPANGEWPGRALWARGDTDVLNCDLGAHDALETVHAGGAGRAVTVSLEDTQYADPTFVTESGSTIEEANTGTAPTLSSPTGVPDTEQEAYGGTTATADASPGNYEQGDFTVVDVGYGEHHVETVESGQSLANVVYDLYGSRSSVTIIADGADWAIENVAFEGIDDRPQSVPCFGIVASVPAGETATIDNVYMGDGSAVGPGDCAQASTDTIGPDGEHGRGAVYVRADHLGTLSIDRLTARDWPGGGIVANPDTPGDVHISRAFVKHCGYESVTLPTATSSCEQSVIVNDREVPQL